MTTAIRPKDIWHQHNATNLALGALSGVRLAVQKLFGPALEQFISLHELLARDGVMPRRLARETPLELTV